MVWCSCWFACRAESAAVLLVADLLHPFHCFAVELFLNRDVRHRGDGGVAVPVLLAGREPDDVAGPDFFSGPAPPLRPATAGDHDQVLAERMRVPRRARARL